VEIFTSDEPAPFAGSVTSEAVIDALGYTPADAGSLTSETEARETADAALAESLSDKANTTDLGSAAFEEAGVFASASQGVLAEIAYNRFIGMQDTAGVVPYRLPLLESPYIDFSAEAAITAAGVTDDRGKEHYRRLVSGLKGLGVWSSLENGYLLGTAHNASSTTIHSLTGNNTATGTSTFSETYATFNGTSDKYTFSNRTPTTAAAGLTYVAFYKADQTSTAIKSIISNYAPSPSRGFTLNLGTSFAGGADNLVALGSFDGSGDINVNNVAVDLASDSEWSFGAASILSGTFSVIGNCRQPNQGALAAGKTTVWNNNPNYIFGATTTGAQFYKGNAVFFGVWNSGLSNAQLFAIKLLLESVFSDALPLKGAIIFDGNSLTAAATGGGTTWPEQLLAMPSWSGVTRWENVAQSGALQTRRGENNYFTKVRRWIPIAGQTVHYVLWPNVNDCTAGVPSATIIASTRRHIRRAKAEGLNVVILTITPVSGYGWGSTQQTIRTEVNAWTLTTAASEGIQVIDLNEISLANPDFGDPSLTTYYVDGLHHNDAGRALIAAKVAAELTPP
jgi:hypothetical protein